MKSPILVLLFLLTATSGCTQSIKFLKLPPLFEKELEVSGLTGNAETFFFASERCQKIIAVDKKDKQHQTTFDLSLYLPKEIQNIELEGLSLYHNHLIMTDEYHAKLYAFDWTKKDFQELVINGKDLSKLKGSYGMEGVAVDERNNLLYLLREKNKQHQSEIHVFEIQKDQKTFILNYSKSIYIQHKNKHWRYSGLCLDPQNNRLLCLKSYWTGYKNMASSKLEIEYIQLDSTLQTIPKNWTTQALISISNEVNTKRSIYAGNLEGIYYDEGTLYITSDNGMGAIDCNSTSKKTAFIQIDLK